jgi:hypothetical protein
METSPGGIAYADEPIQSSVNDAAACRQQDADIADCVAMLVTGLTKPWVIKNQTRSAWMGQYVPPILLEVGWLSWQLSTCNMAVADAGEYRNNTGHGSTFYVSVGTQKIVLPDSKQRNKLQGELRDCHEAFAARARKIILAKIAECPEGELALDEQVSGVCCGQTAFFPSHHDSCVQLMATLNDEHKKIVSPAFDLLKEQLKSLALRSA